MAEGRATPPSRAGRPPLPLPPLRGGENFRGVGALDVAVGDPGARAAPTLGLGVAAGVEAAPGGAWAGSPPCEDAARAARSEGPGGTGGPGRPLQLGEAGLGQRDRAGTPCEALGMALGAGRQSLWGPGPPLARQQDPARGRGRPSHRSEGRATPRARYQLGASLL